MRQKKSRGKAYSTASRSGASSSKARKVWRVILIVALSLLFTVAIAIGVGALLKQNAEKIEAYLASLETTGETADEKSDFPTETDAVQAVGYKLGGVYAENAEMLSVVLVTETGELRYRSAVEKEKTGTNSSVQDLSPYVSSLHREGRKVSCAVFSSFNSYQKKSTRALTEYAVAYEISLLCEIADAGADEILLLGIDVYEENAASVAAFLRQIKEKIGAGCSLGIEIDVSLARDVENGNYTASLLRDSCDFLALDFRSYTTGDGSFAETLESVKYPIALYGMRLTVSRGASAAALSYGVKSYQVIWQ